MDASQKLARAYRAILVLALVAAGAGAFGTWAWYSRAGRGGENAALFDPELRRQAFDELVARGANLWDSFPDATVARVLQPGLKARPLTNFTVDSNELGLRERPVAMPKPEGVTRVVLLGDSFVMGYGVAANERVGSFLERLLQEHAHAAPAAAGPAATAGPIECLHFGVMTWNVISECAFLRRQLSLARPDLVVQIAVRNDLEDNPGARGTGTLASFWPRAPERGDGIFVVESPRFAFGTRENTWLLHGLDWESRSRLEESGRCITQLAQQVTKRGGRYLLFNNYSGLLELAQRYLAAGLDPQQSVPFPTSVSKDERYRLSKVDTHWSRAGHELAALLLYEVIRTRGLLPRLALDPVAEASAAAQRLLAEAEAEIAKPPSLKKLLERRAVASELAFDRLDDDAAAQVTGGVVRGGIVFPYASLLLRCEGRAKLVVAGHGLKRTEIDGVHVAVFVEEAQVGTLTVAADGKFESTFDLPAAIAGRTFVSVRFQSDDFAYALPDLRTDVVFALDRVALTKG